MNVICQDLTDEYNELDDLVSGLSEKQWNTVTPFFEWTIKDEIAHIAYFDSTAQLATQDRKLFMKKFESFLAEIKPGESMFEVINRVGRAKPVEELMTDWRNNRTAMVDALSKLDPKARLPWYGPDMSAKSFATARLMETWAHGQDVYDTLRIKRKPAARIKHIAHLGVTTFGWSFMVRQLEAPADPVRVNLDHPFGDNWIWGPNLAENSVSGSAEDFCLVVTQRRNIADTNLEVKGEVAEKWMSIAQAFAGMPEDPPKPGVRVITF